MALNDANPYCGTSGGLKAIERAGVDELSRAPGISPNLARQDLPVFPFNSIPMISTVPNFLTLLRIALIPFIVLLYLADAPGIWVAGVFLLTSATDWLDGFLARRMNQVSPFGAFLDPVADKLMIAVVLVMLVSDRQVLNATLSPEWFCRRHGDHYWPRDRDFGIKGMDGRNWESHPESRSTRWVRSKQLFK